ADPKEQATQIEQGVRNDLRKVRGLPTAVLTALQRSLALTPAGRFPHAGAFAEAILLGLPSDSGGDRITADAPGAGLSAEPDLTLLIEPAPGGGTTTRASTPISLGTRYATPVPRATAWMPRVSPITPP